MEQRFQYHVPFTDHTQYRVREHYNRFGGTHPLNSCLFSFMHIYIEDMRTKNVSECAVTSEQSVLVKITNNNFVPTLHGFHWYPFFVAQEQLVAFEASK